MGKMIKLILPATISLFFFSGCSSDPATADMDLFQYKDSFVGDNSAVVNTIIQLQGAENFSGMELKTKEQPYGIIVNYDWPASEMNKKETAVHNASYLFTLIKNVDWISFNFDLGESSEQYQITREDLQAWYGMDLREIEDEARLEELLQKSLEDGGKMDQFQPNNN